MTYDASLWIIFILLSLCTLLPRGSFIILGSRVALPGPLQRALRYAPAAALAAIVVPDVLLVGGELAPFNPKLAAAIAAVTATLLWRNPWLPFIAGMAALHAARLLAGV